MYMCICARKIYILGVTNLLIQSLKYSAISAALWAALPLLGILSKEESRGPYSPVVVDL